VWENNQGEYSKIKNQRHAFFNNDAKGLAVKNARRLKELLEG